MNILILFLFILIIILSLCYNVLFENFSLDIDEIYNVEDVKHFERGQDPLNGDVDIDLTRSNLHQQTCSNNIQDISFLQKNQYNKVKDSSCNPKNNILRGCKCRNSKPISYDNKIVRDKTQKKDLTIAPVKTKKPIKRKPIIITKLPVETEIPLKINKTMTPKPLLKKKKNNTNNILKKKKLSIGTLKDFNFDESICSKKINRNAILKKNIMTTSEEDVCGECIQLNNVFSLEDPIIFQIVGKHKDKNLFNIYPTYQEEIGFTNNKDSIDSINFDKVKCPNFNINTIS